LEEFFDDLEGDLMLQNMTQVFDVKRSMENPLRHSLNIFLKIIHDMEFNNPLYFFTLPGFTLVAGGLYMNLNFVQTFYLEGSFDFESAALIFLITLVGTFMAFLGILLHSITGMIRYKIKSLN
jgi:hypothetical protein